MKLEGLLKEVAKEYVDLCRDIIKLLNPFFKEHFGVEVPQNMTFKIEVLPRFTPVKNVAYYFVKEDFILIRFPHAFIEPSLKDVAHELTHVAQALKYGKKTLLKDTGKFEEEAYRLENMLYFKHLPQEIKERGEILEALLDSIAILLAYKKYRVLDVLGQFTLYGLDDSWIKCREGLSRKYPEECRKVSELVKLVCKEVGEVKNWRMCTPVK